MRTATDQPMTHTAGCALLYMLAARDSKQSKHSGRRTKLELGPWEGEQDGAGDTGKESGTELG